MQKNWPVIYDRMSRTHGLVRSPGTVNPLPVPHQGKIVLPFLTKGKPAEEEPVPVGTEVMFPVRCLARILGGPYKFRKDSSRYYYLIGRDVNGNHIYLDHVYAEVGIEWMKLGHAPDNEQHDMGSMIEIYMASYFDSSRGSIISAPCWLPRKKQLYYLVRYEHAQTKGSGLSPYLSSKLGCKPQTCERFFRVSTIKPSTSSLIMRNARNQNLLSV